MKIYTRGGDGGESALLGGRRVSKDHLRLEAFGTVDELNAHLGVTRAAGAPQQIETILLRLQHEMFALGAELAAPSGAPPAATLLGSKQIERIERTIDACEAQLPPLTQFILPAGTPVAAALQVARCVCRRAERRLATLAREEAIRGEPLAYLNRVGDLLFVLARLANRLAGAADLPWRKDMADEA